MENCFFTKLKEVVNNDNLKKLGAFELSFVNASDENISIIYGDNLTPRTLDERITCDSGITITPTQTTSARYLLISGTGKIYCADKYKINKVVLRGGVKFDIDDLSYSSLHSLSLEDYFIVSNILPTNLPETLESLTIYNISTNGDIQDNIASIGSLPNLTSLFLKYNTGITGELREIAQLFPNLTSLGNTHSTGLSGSFEDFVAIRKVQDVTSGSVTIARAGVNNSITFNDASATSSGDTLLPFEWTSDGNNVTITYNGESTVITVASDGTWTRVS